MNSAPSSIPVPNGQVRIAAIYNGNAMFGVHLKRDVPWVPLEIHDPRHQPKTGKRG